MGKGGGGERGEQSNLAIYHDRGLLSITITAPDFLSTTSTTFPSVHRVPYTAQHNEHHIKAIVYIIIYLRVGVASVTLYIAPHVEPGLS